MKYNRLIQIYYQRLLAMKCIRPKLSYNTNTHYHQISTSENKYNSLQMLVANVKDWAGYQNLIISHHYYIVQLIFLIMILSSLKYVPQNIILKNITFLYHQLQPQQYEHFNIQHYQLGQRLDRYLKNTNIGWISAQKYLRSSAIFVLKQDGRMTNENDYRFTAGDKVLIRKGRGIQKYLVGNKNMELTRMDAKEVDDKFNEMVIFDNKNISVLNKPHNYSVQGGSNHSFNLFSLMASRFKKDMIYISHRLDKPTTGLVLIPKNLETAQLIGKALETRAGLDKYYLALTEGTQIVQKQGMIRSELIWTSKRKAKISQSLTQSKECQLAISSYICLKSLKIDDVVWRNLLAVKLVTGRKHQIRCQLSQSLLNPIINDGLYSGRKEDRLKQAILLHSFGITISSKEIIEKIFQIKTEKGVVEQNQKGILKMVDGQLNILGFLPGHWEMFEERLERKDLQLTMQRLGRLDGKGLKKGLILK